MLDDLGRLYERFFGPPGLDWEKLDEAAAREWARTHPGEHLDAIKGEAVITGYYMAAMWDAQLRFLDAVEGMGPAFVERFRSLDNQKAKTSTQELITLLGRSAEDFWAAVKGGDWDASWQFPSGATVNALATLVANAVNAAEMHYSLLMQRAVEGGALTWEEVGEHADSVTRSFQTFARMYEDGDFDSLKNVKPTSGVGAVPAVATGVVVLGVAAVLATCYIVWVFSVASPAQTKALEWCDKVVKSGASKEDMMACAEMAERIAQNGNPSIPNIFEQLGKSVLAPLLTVVAIGGAIYLASVMFLKKRVAA